MMRNTTGAALLLLAVALLLSTAAARSVAAAERVPGLPALPPVETLTFDALPLAEQLLLQTNANATLGGATTARASSLFLDVHVAFGLGIGGWTDRSYTETDPSGGSYETVQQSLLSGTIAHLGIGVEAAPGIVPLLRVSFGAGSFSYEQPGRGPDGTGYDGTSNRRVDGSFSRLSFSLALHFEARLGGEPAEGSLASQSDVDFRLFAEGGITAMVPFVETWRFQRDDPEGEQRYSVNYEPGLGAYGEVGLLLYLNESFSFRVGLFFEAVRTAFDTIEVLTGRGAYATSPSGTIRFDDGDFEDETSFGSDGERRVHTSSSEGFRGVVAAWGFSLGVQILF